MALRLVPPTSPGLTTRPVTAADVPVLCDLFGQDRPPVLLDLQFSAREQQYAAAYPDAVDQLLEVDGEPVGRLLTTWIAGRERTELRVVDLVVTRALRRRGVATAALAPWLAQAGRLGAQVTLHVARDNPAAVAFYTALGFRPDPTDGATAPTDLLMRLDPQELPR